MMEPLTQQAIVLISGWTSGISIYLTVALLGLSDRFHWISLPGDLKTLGHPVIIIAAIAVFVIEFVADKVPYVDSAWDSVHTFIRPLGAAGLGYLAGTDGGPVAQTLYAVLTGTIALDSHAVKASTRLAVNTSPEPFSNIATSIAEHSFVIFIFWLFIKHPFIALGIVLALLVLSYFILRLLWRFFVKVFRWLFPKRQESIDSGHGAALK